ncbi:MAG TPA: hypothetical protein PKW35_01765, partial [Nannocystaceae bacterium]|nr:hypothetical protein [Nannocystaceae bacterium]
MSAVERELEAIIRREAEDVRPPEGAKARGWERLVAALPTDPGDEGGPGDGGEGGPGDGGEGGPGDGGGGGGSALPAGPVPLLKAAPVLKVVSLAVLLAVGAVVWSEVGGGPPVVAGDLPRELEPAPALHFGTRIHIPFAPEPGAGP